MSTGGDLIEQTRLLSARQEAARVRAELVDLRTEADAWRVTIADLERQALELQSQINAEAQRLDAIKRRCSEIPAALQQAVTKILEEATT